MITLNLSLDINEAQFKGVHDAVANQLQALDERKFAYGSLSLRDLEIQSELGKLMAQLDADVDAWVKRRRAESDAFNVHHYSGA